MSWMISEASLTVLSAVGTVATGAIAQLPPELVPIDTDPPLMRLTLFQAIVVGLIQGFTEFLPISSTAHIKVIPVLLGWGDPGIAFTAVIQLGSIGAILWYFWKDLVQVTTGTVKAIARYDHRSKDFRLGMGIILGTIPIVVFGLMVKILISDFDRSPLRNMASIAIASIVMSGLMAIAELFCRHKRDFDSLGMRDGIWMGFSQALAIIPGVSRSGATLTAGLFMGLERATAARFSFLLGIPAITLAGLVELRSLLDVETSNIGILPTVAGVIAAAISSYISIVWLLRFLQNHTTWIFVWYRLAFGIAILGGIAIKVVENI